VPEELVRLVLEKTQGNPFYIEEMVLALRESQNLVWDQAAERYELIQDAKEMDLPETIQGVILSRLDRLPEEQRRMLQVASVFGRKFSGDVLRSVLPFQQTPESLDSKLQLVARLELIDSAHPQPSPSYAFRHALVQEVAYESLSYARRREIHRAIGEDLERDHKDEMNEHCDVLARHFDLGRDSKKAAGYLVMAGDKAKRVYANAEAADYYERGLAHLRAPTKEGRPQVICRVLEELADVRSLTGDYAAAVNRYREALERAVAPVERARLEGKLGGVCYRQGQLEQGIEHLEAGLGHLGIRAPRTRWHVRASLLRQILVQAAHTMLPWVFIRQRSENREAIAAAIEIYESVARISFEFDLEKCLDAHLRQLNLCETVPGSPEMAQTYSSHGIVCSVVPYFRRAVRYQRKGLAIRMASQDRWGVAQSLNFMGVNYYCMGFRKQSLSCLEESARILNEVGDRWESEVTYLFLSFNYLRSGELELAVQHARTCLDQSRQAEDSQGMGWALWALADATSRQGKLAEALEHGRQALECSEEARDRMWVAVVRRELGEIHLRMGNRQQAIEEMEKSLQQIRKFGLRHEFVMGAFSGLAEAYLSVLDDENDHAARRVSLQRIRKLCRQAVSKARKFPNWLGYAYRVSALYEWRVGDGRAARRFFERSIETSASLGASYELGMTYYDMGRFLLEAGRPEAGDCLDQAARLFEQCGAVLDRDQAKVLTLNLRRRIDHSVRAGFGRRQMAN
jgi:tetratricopeptide (TPR) repeat protein